MSSATQSRYRERIEQAVRLLSARLADPPSIEVLAREVAISRYHFQRLYRAATGETLLGTLARLRAVRALELLEVGEASITEISAAVGYETPQAFARAFRDWTGLSPSEARGEAGTLKARFIRPDTPETVPLSVEIVALAPLTLTIIHTRQPIGPLNAVYEALFGAVAGAGRLEDVHGIYGVPLNDPLSDPEALFEHMAALDVAGEVIADHDSYNVAGGPVVHTCHTGSFEDLDRTSLALYAQVLKEGWELADRPALHHHLDDPDQVPAAALRTDIYLALKETV